MTVHSRRPGDHVQAVAAGRQRLALDRHRMRHGEHRVLVGAGAPRALAVVEAEVVDPVRHQRAEDLAAAVVAVGRVDVGAAVGDGDLTRPICCVTSLRWLSPSGGRVSDCAAARGATASRATRLTASRRVMGTSLGDGRSRSRACARAGSRRVGPRVSARGTNRAPARPNRSLRRARRFLRRMPGVCPDRGNWRCRAARTTRRAQRTPL